MISVSLSQIAQIFLISLLTPTPVGNHPDLDFNFQKSYLEGSRICKTDLDIYVAKTGWCDSKRWLFKCPWLMAINWFEFIVARLGFFCKVFIKVIFKSIAILCFLLMFWWFILNVEKSMLLNVSSTIKPGANSLIALAKKETEQPLTYSQHSLIS